MSISYDEVYNHHSNLNIDPWQWMIEEFQRLAGDTSLTGDQLERAYNVLSSEPHGEWHLFDADTSEIITRERWDDWLKRSGIKDFDEACDATMFDLIISRTGTHAALTDIEWALRQ